MLSDLALALVSRAFLELFCGDLVAAASLTDEADAVNDATGGNLAPYGRLGLAALRGNLTEAEWLMEATKQEVAGRGEGSGIAFADWAGAVLNNGLGRFDAAATAAQRAFDDPRDRATVVWAPVELVEAAVRSGRLEAASRACERVAEVSGATRTEWALGVQARCQALLSTGDTAEGLYREAIAHLEPTRIRVDLARTHLLYGEWLSREHRRTDAREHLRTACSSFEAMALTGFADRARRELRAAGGTARKRAVPAQSELTAQETQIARMARDGLSNPEIAGRLFISARTVQYHLGKVFTKLGITSRSQLDRVLPR